MDTTERVLAVSCRGPPASFCCSGFFFSLASPRPVFPVVPCRSEGGLDGMLALGMLAVAPSVRYSRRVIGRRAPCLQIIHSPCQAGM
ncbi:hypothetical protein HDK64DRAFT_268997 [Phyllosticta capitalensis]